MPPLCFVLMPFGKKPAADGRIIDFDAVYAEMIQPAGHGPLPLETRSLPFRPGADGRNPL